MGARRAGSAKVTGSSPVGSIMRKRGFLFINFLFVTSVCAPASTIKNPKTVEVDSLKRIKALEYASIAIGYYQRKDYEKALENFRKSYEEDSLLYSTIIGIARTSQDLGDIVTAEEFYKKGISLYPDSNEGYLGLAGVFLATQKYTQAIEVYKKGLEVDPRETDFYLGLANAYEKMEKKGIADSIYKEGIKLDPQNLALRNYYADFLIKNERYKEAVEHLSPILERYPEDLMIRKKLASVYTNLKKYDEAESHYKFILSKRPDDVEIMLKLGTLYMTAGLTRKAGDCFIKAVELKPDDPTTHLYLGHYYLHIGNLSKAESQLRKSIELQKDFTPSFVVLGDLYARKAHHCWDAKRWREGKTYCDKGIEYYSRSLADPNYKSYANERIKYLKDLKDKFEKKIWFEGK